MSQAARTNNGRPRLARRLVYIVNRRTVVDQATDDAKHLLGCIYRSGQLDGLPWATEEAIDALGLKPEPGLAANQAPVVAAIRTALATLSGGDATAPLAVSTLRGELADNGEWKVNPARPAIIIGTVDMIGSKLLFSGYGDGRYGRAHHAGLIGQDALIVHDEAHLSPALSKLLRAVEQEQDGEFKRNGQLTNVTRPIRVMELSATTRSDSGSGGASQVFGVEDEDGADSVVQQRLTATKRLSLAEIDAGKKDALVSAIVEASLKHDDERCRVLVYVRSPETAASVVDGIKKKLTANSGTAKRGRGPTDRSCDREGADKDAGVADAGPSPDSRGSDSRVCLLTGTIRGYERDQLAESSVFKAFKADPTRALQLEHTLYLISTSAGEVGVDFDADHLVCDLTTLDSMAQRFGRVNRLGGKGRFAKITLIVEKPAQREADKPNKKSKTASLLDAAIAKTAEILRSIAENGGDVSPAALAKIFDGLSADDKRAAFSPTPTILPATDILFDAWSLTSIAGELPGRPEVAPYLHGVADWEPSETYVAWRAELAELARADVSKDDLEEVFDAFPIRAAERLRDRTYRVFDKLRRLADRLDQDHARAATDADAPRPRLERDPRLVLIKQNKVQWVRLSELAPADENQKDLSISRLAYAIVVLPVEAGGLKEDGTLDESALPPDDPTALDVAEATATGQRGRRRVWINTDDTETPLIAVGGNGALPCKLRITLADDEEATDELDGGSRKIAIEYRVEKGEAAESGVAVTLNDHSSAVEAAAKRIGQALDLPNPIRDALTRAARWHDAGKARAVWQRYARNGDHSAAPLAKAPRYLHPKALGGYRHEFGSQLDAARPAGAAGVSADMTAEIAEVANHPERDLILHLIAAHHGWGRPHFESKAFDRERPTSENEIAAVEVLQRFGRLQQRFGRWGLAWLESLLRCADAMASESPTLPDNVAARDDGAPGGAA